MICATRHRQGAWALGLVWVCVAACEPSPWPAQGDLIVDKVPCRVATGERLEPAASPLLDDSIGPQACARALELYLKAHAPEHIGIVTPLLVPDAGTRALRVERTARSAPWPRGEDLSVKNVLCGDGLDEDCAHALEQNRSERIWQWVPLQEIGADGALGTRGILYVIEEGD